MDIEQENFYNFSDGFDEDAESSITATVPVETEKVKKSYAEYITETVFSTLYIILQCTVLITFLAGAATAFGTNINIISFLTLFLKIFSVNASNVYISLSSLVLAIVYIIAFIILIKQFISSIRTFFIVIKTKTEKTKHYDDLYTKSQNTIFIFIVYLVTCFVFTAEKVSGWVMALLVIDAVLITAGNGFAVTIRNYGKIKSKIFAYIMSLVRPVVIAVLLFMLASYLLQPSIYNLSFGFKIIFGGHFGAGTSGVIGTLYEYLIKDVLYFICGIFYLIMVNSALIHGGTTETGNKICNDDLNRASIKLIVITAISAGITCILLALQTGVSSVNSATLLNWFTVIKKSFVPAILLLIAIKLSVKSTFVTE